MLGRMEKVHFDGLKVTSQDFNVIFQKYRGVACKLKHSPIVLKTAPPQKKKQKQKLVFTLSVKKLAWEGHCQKNTELTVKSRKNKATVAALPD